jgi:hypothetical protein
MMRVAQSQRARTDLQEEHVPDAHDERLELITQQRMQRFDLRHRDCMLQHGTRCCNMSLKLAVY